MFTNETRRAITIFAAIVLAVAIIFGGSAITASAAKSALPGDTLHPVKISIEQFRLSMTRDAVARAELHLEFAERRLEEVKSLIAEGRFQNIQNATLEFEIHINNALAELDVIAVNDPVLAADLMGRITDTLTRYTSALRELIGKIPEPVRTEVQHSISDVSSRVSDNLIFGGLSGWSVFEDFNNNDNYNDNMNDNYNDNTNDNYNDNMNDNYNDNTNDNYNDNMNDSCTFGSVYIDELIVPEDATCTLNGTKIEGNIFVYGNSTLLAYDVWVGGNIQADHSARVEVYSGSYVGGNIQVDYGGVLVVSSVRIGGNLQAFNNWGSQLYTGNFIGGDLQVFENSGGVSIKDNTIEGNLQCKENYPAPTGGSNSVYGNKEDQCSDL